jgi:prevent-host-death family protein
MEVGIRALQRATSRFVALAETGVHLIVTRYGRPVAVLVPLERAQSFVLQNRPLGKPSIQRDEETEWLLEGSVRVAWPAEEAFDDLNDQTRSRLLHRLRRLRHLAAAGRLVVRAGRTWVLVDLEGEGGPVTVLAVGARVDLQRWLWGGEDRSVADAAG